MILLPQGRPALCRLATYRFCAPVLFALVGTVLAWGQIKIGVPAAPTLPKAAPAGKVAPKGPARRASQERPLSADYNLGLAKSGRPIWNPPVSQPEKLGNGITVFLHATDEIPVVQGMVAIGGGWTSDSANHRGVSEALLFTLLEGGTRTKTPEQMRAALDAAGVRLNGVVSAGALEISFQCETANLITALDLVRELLTEAQLRRSALENIKARLRAGVANRNRNIAEIARREADIAASGKGSSWDRKVDFADIASISRESLETLAKERLIPARVALGLSGKFDPALVRSHLAGTLGSWQAAGANLPAIRRSVPEAPSLHVANLSGSPVAYLEIVYPLVRPAASLTPEESAAVLLFARLLRPGGGLKLASVVQPFLPEGASYTVQTGVELGSSPVFRFSSPLRPREAMQAALRIAAEIERWRTSKIEEDALAGAKDRAIFQTNFDFARRDVMIRILTVGAATGLGPNHFSDILRAAAAMTSSAYSAHLRSVLDPKQVQTVIAGDIRDFRMAPEEAGLPVTNISMEIPPAPPEKLLDDPESERLGKEWLAKWRAAAGGEEKLTGLKDASWVYAVKLFTSGGAIPLEQRVLWRQPGVYRQEQKASFGNAVLFFDGKVGWNHSGRGLAPLGTANLEQIKGEIFRFPFRLALCDRIDGCKVNYAGSGVLQMRDKDGFRVEVALDPVTNLPESYSFLERRAEGGTYLRIVERFSDYRPVNGVLLAHKTDVEQEGARFAEFLMNDPKVNAGLTAEEIGKRP